MTSLNLSDNFSNRSSLLDTMVALWTTSKAVNGSEFHWHMMVRSELHKPIDVCRLTIHLSHHLPVFIPGESDICNYHVSRVCYHGTDQSDRRTKVARFCDFKVARFCDLLCTLDLRTRTCSASTEPADSNQAILQISAQGWYLQPRKAEAWVKVSVVFSSPKGFSIFWKLTCRVEKNFG